MSVAPPHTSPRQAIPPQAAVSAPPALTRARARRRLDPWRVATAVVALVIAFPAFRVAASLGQGFAPIWSHLAETVLTGYLLNTLALALSVGALATVIGTGCAWAVTMARFPGRRVLELALLLPMAMPAYIIAYTYTDLLQFSGPVQSALRDAMGWDYGDYWFPEIRSFPGCAVVMALVLYPYVYLMARSAFLEQSVCVLEVARTLGAGPGRVFWRVALPLARPALAGGVALVMMETCADFGAVQYFGIDTFTVAIFRTWFALAEPVAALQLAAMLMGVVFLVLGAERASRGRARFFHTSSKMRPLPRPVVAGWRGALVSALVALPILLGFVVPAIHLAQMTLARGDAGMGVNLWRLTSTSFALAAAAAALATALAILVGYGVRLRATRFMRLAARLAALGYAVPGSVVAVGVLMPLAGLDNWIDGLARAQFGHPTGLILTGTVTGLLYAYVVRFLSIALSSVEAGLAKIRPTMGQVARTLGAGPWRALTEVHMPLMWPSIATASIMVFVDTLKELPATLILRPFEVETLATRVYRYAADERLAEASTAALVIVIVSVVPVALLARTMRRAG